MLVGMHHVAFSMQFRGHSTWLSPGVLTARATAPSSALVTQVDPDGVHAHLEARDGEEAHLECRLTFLDDSRFEEVGTISFGNGNALRFRSAPEGTLGSQRAAGPAPRRRLLGAGRRSRRVRGRERPDRLELPPLRHR